MFVNVEANRKKNVLKINRKTGFMTTIQAILV